MVFHTRRYHFSRKQQVIVILSALLFTTYYIIFHLGALERTADLDYTRQIILGVERYPKAQPNTVKKEPKQIINTLKVTAPLHQDTPLQTMDDFGTNPLSSKGGSFTARLYNSTPNFGDREQLNKYIMHYNLQVILKTVKPDKWRIIDILNIHKLFKKHRESILMYIENTLRESLKEDKGTGCEVPVLNPFAAEIMQFDKKLPNIVCSGQDWVKCYYSKCTIDQKLIEVVGDSIECTYNDILYESDNKYSLGPPTALRGNKEYMLNRSDHVKIKCKLGPNIPNNYSGGKSWIGHGVGYRPVKPGKPPPGRENTFNVLIFGFDSTSKNGFIRKMPKSYKFLTEELNAVVLNGYNIVGDGTPAALFPLLTGKTELELPESRKSIRNSGHLDDMPWLFYKLKKDGYRTAYYEDMPQIGTFQYRFNGFRHQPSDHYLRDFYLEADKSSPRGEMGKYCVGDTPRHKLMMNITDQFLKLDGKRFVFTFVADITHDQFNMIFNADEPFMDFLTGLKKSGVFKDTLLVVMGDHGPRYADVRQTLQGKMEERLPLMAIRLPDNLKSKRPEAFENLISNVNILTTIHDVYATVLDVIDMREHWNSYKVQGADLTRGMTLLETINKNRSCSEAGIEPHWCTCLKWEPVRPDDPMHQRTAQALLDHINHITEYQRSKCVIRTLTSIDWVTKKRTNTKLLQFQGAKDHDGYVGKFGPAIQLAKDVYQVKITVGPGIGVYEGAVTHLVKENKFSINTREISRINAYNKEPKCISAVYPHLNMFCYCIT